MNWRRLTLRVDACDVEAASAVLATATRANVAIDDGAISVDPRGRPSRSVISAYVPASRARQATNALRSALVRARCQGLLGSVLRGSASVRDEDWAIAWKRYYRPSKLADGLYVVPSWHGNFRAPRGARVIQLDPGMAFGTGQHATTKMALQLLLEYVRAGKPMLDIGCGSGILGLAAAQRGAKVYASDVDPIAIAATRKNFKVNHLRAAAVARVAGIPRAFPKAPLIAANITADVLAPLAGSLARSLTRGGAVITSGVTKRGRLSVLAAFAAAGLRMAQERKSGEWISHVHVREA